MTKAERQKLMNIIIEEYKNTPDNEKCIQDLVKKYNVKHETIKKYLIQAGVEIITNRRTKNPDKTKLINQAVDEYINTPEWERSAAATAKKYGINRKTIIAYAIERGFTPTQHHNKPNFNNTVFDIIDTEEKAYWLGFMYADGWISSKGHIVGLTLAEKDIEHLKKFNEFLQYPKGCVVKKNGFGIKGNQLWACSTQIGDQHLWDALYDKGCIPNKSLILEFPTSRQVPTKLLRHFIRGYCDGDGSLGIYNNHNSLSFIGTEQFLEKVMNSLNITGNLYWKTNKSEEVHVLKYSGKKAAAIAEILYKDSNIYLERKYNIYLRMCPPKSKDLGNNSGSNGEGCDANPVLTSEITQGSEEVERIESE